MTAKSTNNHKVPDKETSRLSSLIAIVTQLQSKRLLTSTEVAKKFNVSVRTVYRDIKTLEQAGVPIITEEGKGYSLQEDYRLPPIMFTENEANALITATHGFIKKVDKVPKNEVERANNLEHHILNFLPMV